MSKLQKGRKHREVNRTPRPVSSPTRTRANRATTAGKATAARTPAAHPEAPAPAPTSAPTPTSAPASAPEPAPASPAVAAAESSPSPETVASAEEVDELFRTPARDGGLGQSAGRTWERVKVAGASGATVEELSASVGYQERTVLKHLQSLAEHGLVEQHGPDRWRALPTGVAGEQSAAADEARVPQRA